MRLVEPLARRARPPLKPAVLDALRSGCVVRAGQGAKYATLPDPSGPRLDRAEAVLFIPARPGRLPVIITLHQTIPQAKGDAR